MDIGIDLAAAGAAAWPGAPAAARQGGSEELAALFAAFVDNRLPLDPAATAGAVVGSDTPVEPGAEAATDAAVPASIAADDDERDDDAVVVDCLAAIVLPQTATESVALSAFPSAPDPVPVDADVAAAPPVATAAQLAQESPAAADGSAAAVVVPDGAAGDGGVPPAPSNVTGEPMSVAAPPFDIVVPLPSSNGDGNARADEPPAAPSAQVTAPEPDGLALPAPVRSPRSLSPAGRALARALGVLEAGREGGRMPAGEPAAAAAAVREERPVDNPRVTASPSAWTPVDAPAAKAAGTAARAALNLPQAAEARAVTVTELAATGETGGGGRQAAPGDVPVPAPAARNTPSEAAFRSMPLVAVAPAAGATAGSGAQMTGDAGIAFASAAPIVDTSDDGEIAGQLVKAIRMQVRDGIGVARLQLRPEHLGEVEIELTVSRDRVSAVVHAERSDVRAQIEAQGATLRAGLNDVGLHLEELTVRDDGASRERQNGRDRTTEEQRRPRRGQPDKEFVLVA